MPPLRERREDIRPLVEYFTRQLAEEVADIGSRSFGESALQALEAYGWPGNVRELRNTIERTLILGRFPAEFHSTQSLLLPGGETLQDMEKRHILMVLEEAGGNRAEAARRLGISRKTIDRKLMDWNG